jgi:hypothetical protein
VRMDIYGQDVLHGSAFSGLNKTWIGLHNMPTVTTGA